MKRLSVILFTAFYLVLSAGVHVHIDKCCASIHAMILVLSDECCDAESDGEPKKKSCSDHSSGCGDHKDCDKDELHLQFSEEFVPQLKVLTMDIAPAIHAPADFKLHAHPLEADIETVYAESPDPPRSVYKLNSSYLLYA